MVPDGILAAFVIPEKCQKALKSQNEMCSMRQRKNNQPEAKGSQGRTQTTTDGSGCITHAHTPHKFGSRLKEIWGRVCGEFPEQLKGSSGQPLGGARVPQIKPWHLFPTTRPPPLAAAAKSLQSCPTLCDSRDSSPPGSPVPGILQARTLEWGAISFFNA